VIEQRAQPRDLLGGARDERLTAPPGADGHAQREVDRTAQLGQRGNRGRGVDRDADAGAALADQVRGVRGVRRGLDVKGQRVRAGAHELRDLALGSLDHEVHVEHPSDLLDLLA
jgi:hypothetical protein